MKIAVVTHSVGGRGGMEQVVWEQVKGLERLGHDVDLVTGPDLGAGRVARAASGGALAARGPQRLRGYDCAVAHYPPAPWLAATARIPFLYYFHHPFRALYPTESLSAGKAFSTWSTLARPLGRLDTWATRAASEVAVPSPSVAAEFARVFGLRSAVVPPGVDTSVFMATGAPRGDHLLFVGRGSDPYKHLDWSLEVARSLRRELRIVGPLSPEQIATLPAFARHTQYLDGARLAAEYQAAAVLLFPSVREDFGLVPLEAMACGLPVVAFNDGHGPTFTLGKESGGILATPYDLGDFTRLVRMILEDRSVADALERTGPRYVSDRFQWHSHCSALVDILSRLAGD